MKTAADINKWLAIQVMKWHVVKGEDGEDYYSITPTSNEKGFKSELSNPWSNVDQSRLILNQLPQFKCFQEPTNV